MISTGRNLPWHGLGAFTVPVQGAALLTIAELSKALCFVLSCISPLPREAADEQGECHSDFRR